MSGQETVWVRLTFGWGWVLPEPQGRVNRRFDRLRQRSRFFQIPVRDSIGGAKG